MYVYVLTEIGAKAVDESYVYRVPDDMKEKIKVGVRVTIPFGKMMLQGFVMEIYSDTDYDKNKIKDIMEVIDDTPVLNEEMLLLGKEMSENLLCSKVSAYQAMLPKALKASSNTNIKIKYEEQEVLKKLIIILILVNMKDRLIFYVN